MKLYLKGLCVFIRSAALIFLIIFMLLCQVPLNKNILTATLLYNCINETILKGFVCFY